MRFDEANTVDFSADDDFGGFRGLQLGELQIGEQHGCGSSSSSLDSGDEDSLGSGIGSGEIDAHLPTGDSSSEAPSSEPHTSDSDEGSIDRNLILGSREQILVNLDERRTLMSGEANSMQVLDPRFRQLGTRPPCVPTAQRGAAAGAHRPGLWPRVSDGALPWQRRPR
jgi:hypothetical protein